MHSPWFIRLYGGLYTDRQVRHLLSFAGLSCPSPRCMWAHLCVCACVCVHVCVSVYARPVRSSVYIWCRRLSCHVTREVLSQKSMSCGPETGVRPQPAPLPQSHTRPSSAPHLKKKHSLGSGWHTRIMFPLLRRAQGGVGRCLLAAVGSTFSLPLPLTVRPFLSCLGVYVCVVSINWDFMRNQR